MAKKRKSGCLSALIFLLVLILSILLIAVLFSSVRSTTGGTLFTELLEKAGFSMKDDQEEETELKNPEYGGLEDLAPTDAIRIEITQEKLRELMEEAMADEFPLTLEFVILSVNGTMELQGRAERDRFLKILDSADTALGALERMALQLAPEELSFDAVIGISYQAESGTIALDPQELTVETLELPVSYLPDGWMSGLNRAMTDYFSVGGRTPAGISIYDGYLHLYFE